MIFSKFKSNKNRDKFIAIGLNIRKWLIQNLKELTWGSIIAYLLYDFPASLKSWKHFFSFSLVN